MTLTLHPDVLHIYPAPSAWTAPPSPSYAEGDAPRTCSPALARSPSVAAGCYVLQTSTHFICLLQGLIYIAHLMLPSTLDLSVYTAKTLWA